MSRVWTVLPILALAAAPAVALDITTCSQTVPRGEVGVLQVDLSCTGVALGEAGVELESGATLQMNGHRIVQPEVPGDLYGFGVHCPSGRCSVEGPGEITGDLVAIVAANLVVTDVVIHDAEAGGIAVVRVPDPRGAENARLGKLVATNLSIIDSGAGVLAKTVFASGLVASGSPYYGVTAHLLRGSDITTNDNGGVGVVVDKCDVDGFTATNNGGGSGLYGGGLLARRSARLTNATVTGNRILVDGVPVDADIVSLRDPRLTNVTCDHSLRLDTFLHPAGSLGICAGD